MLPLLDENNLTYPHFIANKFGYTEAFVKEYYENIKPKQKNKLTLENENKTHRCICCNQIFPDGIKGKDLLRSGTIFPKTYNGSYTLSKPRNKDGKSFICGPCLFSLKFYNKKKMQNVVITKNSIKHISINSATNEMYDYCVKGLDEPFIFIVNSRGKVLEFITYLAVPTISKEIITLVFGEKLMYIDRKLLIECLDDIVKIMNEMEVSKNLLTNAFGDEGTYQYFATNKNKEKENFFKIMSEFHNKYDRDTRVIAAKLLEQHIKRNKKSKGE